MAKWGKLLNVGVISLLFLLSCRFPDWETALAGLKGREALELATEGKGASPIAVSFQGGGLMVGQKQQDFAASTQSVEGQKEQSFSPELTKNLERLHRMELIANVGSWEYLLDEELLLLSAGAQRILGWPAGEQSKGEIYEYTLPEYRQIRSQALTDLVEKGKPYDLTLKLKRASDGAVIDVHSIAEYDPEANRVFGTFHDISELVRKNEEHLNMKRRETYLLAVLPLVQLAVIAALIMSVRNYKRVEEELVRNLERNESLVRILQYPSGSIQELIDYALQDQPNKKRNRLHLLLR